jgi:hypothetical protein
MTIPLTGTQSMFVRVGHMGGTLNFINTNRGTNFLSHVNNTINDYLTTDQSVTSLLWTQATTWQTAQEAFTTFLDTMATNTVEGMVTDDTNLNNITLESAMAELIRQMEVSSNTVNKPTVSVSVTYGNGVISNSGNGSATASVLNGFGVQMDYVFNETIHLVCTTDSQTGGATPGEEIFAVVSEQSQDIPTFYTWPIGSGATGNVQSNISTDSQDPDGNVLNNSGFEVFTTNVPNQWIAVVGTPGTNILAGGSGNAYTGINCLEIVGDGTTHVQLTQDFNSSNGTTVQPVPDTPYLISVYTKVSATPAAGVLQLNLVNGSGSIIDDANGNPCTLSITLSGETTAYAHHSATVRLPRVLPPIIGFQIVESTLVDTGKSIFIDEVVMAPADQLYQGGGFVTVNGGSSPWIQGDTINLVFSNNYAGGFQQLFNRFFNMQALGLQLPSSSSPTISDSLIV